MMWVTAGVLAQAGRVLACRRRADQRFGLKWEFPGGKLEPGETLEECLARELCEELGIAASVGREVHRTEHRYPDGFSVHLVFFCIPRYTGQIRNLAFDRIAWAVPSDLPDYDFLDADRAVVQRLASGEIALP